MKNLAYLLALHTIEGLGAVRLKKIIDHFEDPKLAWEAKTSEWKSLNLPESVINNWKRIQKEIDPESYSDKLFKSGIFVTTIYDQKNYPNKLKEIYDPPVILYYKGELQILNEQKGVIAVVGTRKVSSYGSLVTTKLTTELVESGFLIVSGLARGVDTLAHKATLAGKGLTAAVLGGGLDNVYPPENIRLSREIIASGGVIISENPPSYPATSGTFPSRNRIIAGLSLGVLVTEAAFDSGSLITAKCALDVGREVFAVPGPITSSLSQGPSELIKQGAKLVQSVDDILDELGIEKGPNIKFDMKLLDALSPMEKQILKSLENEQKHIDEICRELRLKSSDVSSTLVRLEIKGIVKNLGGGIYILLS